jgi:hypothetical protein
MGKRWKAVTGIACGVAILGGGALTASAHSTNSVGAAHPASIFESVRSGATDIARFVGIDDEAQVAPGTIDDGKELLPQAKITLEQAIQAAQGSRSGDLGEVDLEHYKGRLVFNVDIGDHDVKVDATTGAVLGSSAD